MPTPPQIDRRVFLKLGLTLGATSAAALGSGAALVSAQEKPKRGGVLTIGRNHDADTLYPGRSTGLSAIATNLLLYDALVLHDFQMKIRPALAEKWDVSADGLTWTFSLRKNVKFHCGAPLTAQDVKEHFDRWIDPKESVPTRAKMASLLETRVVDDHTVVFKLKNPTLVFLNNVSQTEWGYASIPHAKHVGQYGQDYGVVPASVCGTGPYRLKEWIKDDRMELTRNDDYAWGSPAYDNTGAPWVDRLVFRTLPEDASRAAELETGGIDLDIDVSPQHIGRLEGRGVKITSIPRLSSNHIGFNVEKDVFKDARVRKAVAHAVNREQIVQFVMKGQADVAHGFLHPLVPGATPKEQMRPFMYESSPEKSKRLLTEAGWTPGPSGVRQKDGKPLSAACYVFTEQHERLVTPVQATLRDVGFDMQIKRLEAAAFGTATRAGEHDMRFLPMIYSSADFLYFFVSAAIPTPNTVRWRDDRTDSLFQVSQTTLKEPERIKAFQGIEQRLVGEAVVVPIQHVRWIFGSRPRARGLKYHPIHGVYKLMDAWVA
ncbi:MAG TPA: ABC transporter substrate-binding protein [Candidatus Dormibacteraeota bacterium]|nr:ABC transporter substrate-binding protein [Candidatus Dormibacteraeota bacterium]